MKERLLTEFITVRVTPQLKSLLEQKAASMGLRVPDIVRLILGLFINEEISLVLVDKHGSSNKSTDEAKVM